jgi:hypothetical protein
MKGTQMVNIDTDTEYEGWQSTCKNGHDKRTSGWTQLNGCRECKREAARRYRAARKAGIEKQANKQQPRKDLGFDQVKGQ